jgi:hypothetical protein
LCRKAGDCGHLDSDLGGLPNRRTIVLDGATGEALGWEQTLTEDAGLLSVPVPSVISYSVLVEARFVDGTA